MKVQSFPYSETYEYVYSKNRQQGHAMLAHYCHQKVHLKAPKSESLKGPLPLGPNLILPPLLFPVEAKPKVRSYQHCPPKPYDTIMKYCRSIAGRETQRVILRQGCSYQAHSSGDGDCEPVNLSHNYVINSCEIWILFY